MDCWVLVLILENRSPSPASKILVANGTPPEGQLLQAVSKPRLKVFAVGVNGAAGKVAVPKGPQFCHLHVRHGGYFQSNVAGFYG